SRGRVQHHDTTLILNREATTVAGRAKGALHLEQHLPTLLNGVTLGAIVHPEDGARFGARLASHGLTLHANTDLRQDHMVTAAYSNRHLHARLEWNTSKAQPFTARLTTFGAPVRFTYRAHFGQPDATHHLRAAYSPPPDSANRTRAS